MHVNFLGEEYHSLMVVCSHLHFVFVLISLRNLAKVFKAQNRHERAQTATGRAESIDAANAQKS